MANRDEIKVSVCVLTYNQEKYISECLQSLVDQNTSFSFEIIVGEDCSTDGTRKVVEDFQRKYPDLIFPIFHEENVGPVENIIETYKRSRGKYISHVDGDDFANPGKLQKQHDILEGNSDCTICSHDMKLVGHDGSLLTKTFRKYKEGKRSLKDLYETLPFFCHSSKMFVNDLDDDYWSMLNAQALDVEVHVEQAKKGYIYHIDEPLGVYRLGVGVSSEKKGVNPLLPEGIDRIFESAISNSDGNTSFLKGCYAKAYMRYAYQSAVYGDEVGFVKYIKKSINIKIISIFQVCIFSFLAWPKFFLRIASIRNKSRYSQGIG